MNKPIFALALLSVAGASHAQVIFTSSFENNELGTSVMSNPSGFQTINPSSNTLGGKWSVDSGSIDWIGAYWRPSTPKQSIDLNGNSKGKISTKFNTTANHKYRVTFMMAGNPDGSPSLKSLQATVVPAIPNFSDTFTFTTTLTSVTRQNMGWAQRSFEFIGAGGNTTLSFASLNEGAFGAALDDVLVENLGVASEPVPEPFTLALGAAGLMAAIRRRRAR